MGRHPKILQRILSGQADANIRFDELVQLLIRLGFSLRVRGDHHILFRTDMPEILNVQPKGSMAKPYQVKQIRNLILKYHLGVADDE
ncbi:MAG TPA: type II toxin-antitoxin system HicA family toxin [Methylococcaceae bacterium]|nr:type II toxin-antitoxin system HicA family toxin [Methylococcaceae bacterium]